MKRQNKPKIMNGEDTFTQAEVSEIKRLIVEKVRAPKSRQDGIRDKIRAIGFYYSDFRPGRVKGGFTLADFEALISSGVVKVSG